MLDHAEEFLNPVDQASASIFCSLLKSTRNIYEEFISILSLWSRKKNIAYILEGWLSNSEVGRV